MRHLAIPRSTRQRLQKLTAFLTAVAIIAGFLPLGAVKVFADGEPAQEYVSVTLEIEDLDNESATPYDTNVKVEYQATPGDDFPWEEAQEVDEVSIYKFPTSAIVNGSINVRFTFERAEGDPRVITGFKAVTAEKTEVPVLDEYLSDDLCTMTIPFPVDAGVSKVILRVSNANNIEFTQDNGYEDSEFNLGNFYQFRIDRDIGPITIPSGKMLEVFGANVTINGDLTLSAGSKLQVMDNFDDEENVIKGSFAVTGSIIGAEDASILFMSKDYLPAGFVFYRNVEDGQVEVSENDLNNVGFDFEWEWFSVYYDAETSRWVLHEPQDVPVDIVADFLDDDGSDYTTSLKVMYLADPKDDDSWDEAKPEEGTSTYWFPDTAMNDDREILLNIILSKEEADDRVITGLTATVGNNQITPVVDEMLNEDLTVLTISLPVDEGISKLKIRVSDSNNLDFTQANDWNKDNNFYQFRIDREIGPVTVPENCIFEIYGADVTINGTLTLEEGATLQVMDNKDDDQNITTGTLAVTNIIGAPNASILCESKANLPSGLEFYRNTENGLALVTDADLNNDEIDWNWFSIFYEVGEQKWVMNDVDPMEFEVFITDDSNLLGASLTYKVEYQINDGEWTEANLEEFLHDDFPYPDNVDGGTVTIDNDQDELKHLNFRLPNLEEEGDTVAIKITILDIGDLALKYAALAYEQGAEDGIAMVPQDSGDNLELTVTNIDIYGAHKFYMTVDSGFNTDDYYGLSVQIPLDEDSKTTVSANGKSVTLTSVRNNTITVTSDSKLVVENVPGGENQPTLTNLWSDSDKFYITAVTQDGSTAYIYNITDDGSRNSLSSEEPFTVTCDAKGAPVLADINFEAPRLGFNGYESISPAPGTGNWEGALTASSYDIVYENGKVTVELLGTDSTWKGILEHRFDEHDNDYIDEFRIETLAQVKVTFTPDEGFEVDPWILENWNLGDDNSCTIYLSTETNYINNPFREEGDNPPDPQGTCKAVFTGATGMTDENTEDAIVVINYAHGSVTLTQGEGTMGDGDVFNPVWDSETNTITIEYNRTVEFTIDADEDYDSTCKINNVDQGYKDAYSFDAIPETTVDITFTGPSFILEVGGNLKEGTTYEVDDTNKKITLTYDHGTVEITNYISLVEVNGVTPNGSSVVISYEFTLEGNSADVTFIPDENYIFNGMHLDGKDVAPDDERIENGVLSLTGIDKNNKVSIEPRFDKTPVLKIAAVENDSFTYNSLNKTLTFSEDQTDKGTVEITNESDPFSGNPQNYSKITSDITFTITPADGYVCFVMLNNGQELYFPAADTYTLKASDLRSDPVEGNENILTFEFKKLEEDQLAKVKFDGAVGSSGDYYYVSYIDAVAGVQLGSVKISKDAIESCDEETSTFTIKQNVSSLELTITPKTGYTPKLVEYGPEYGDDQTVTGEWTRELTLTNNNGTYSYTLAINPQNGEPVGLRVSFDNTKYIQTTVTYKDYEGVQCAIEIGGNGIPGGDLNNKLVEYETPLSLDANENSKEYVKVEGGKEFVRMQISVPFIYYMSEVKVNGDYYNAELPDTYEELVAAFGSQYTNAIIWVPVSDNYVIETKTVNAVFDEDPEKTTLAVGNFLWFYDESHKDNDDYVKNAYLEIVQVVYNDEVYTKDNIEEGSAISWDVIVTDGEIVGGEATLPAGSYVTMKLIPDYGTQLVSLGLNGGGFTPDQNKMYTYSFFVGPGNFHLNADFEPIEDVVETSATAIDSGSISLGADTVDNGTAVLFVDNAAPDGAAKTNFENAAGTANVEIDSYLDISLDKVVYQGVSQNDVSYSGDDKNVWSEELNDLSSPATITLQLAEDISGDTVKILHEKHDGTIEVIDADYDASTKTVTFETSSFSNYAIAYEKNVPVTYYDLWVGDIQVTSANASNVLGDTGDPTVVYDADTNTLTLNGATITGPVRESASDYDADGGIIYAGEDDFTINVIGGTTTVTGSNTERGTSAGLFFGNPEDVWSDFKFYDVTINIAEGATLNLVGGVPDTTNGYPTSYGLGNMSFGTLTITGSGTLNATGGASKFSYGIDTMQTLIIDGPTVNASGADSIYSYGIYAFNVTVDSGTLTASGGYSEEDGAESYGIDAYSSGATALVINAGAVTATGYTSALLAPAALADGVTAGGSTSIDGTGAVTYVADDNSSYKWFGTPFTINYDLWVGGIQVTSANASNVLGDTGTPTVVYDADTNTLTLNGATITGLNSEVLGCYIDGGIVYTGTADFTIKVTGGTSTVTGGNTKRNISAGLLIGNPEQSLGSSSIPCKTTIIIDEGATLTLVGGVPDQYSSCSIGLICESSGGLTITGSGTLNATGNGGGKIGVSEGIYTSKKLTIDGPTVNASGAANSSVSVIVNAGIYSCGGVIINSGTVTTTAGYIDDYRDWSYGIMNTNNAITINGGTLTASGYSSALNTAPTLGEGVTASGSTNIDGSDTVPYSAADNDSCLWFNTSYTPPTYGISLDQTGTYTFTEATVGYSALTPVTVTVTNTGTGSTGNLTVALSNGSFTLSKTYLSGIAPGGSATFTIVPRTGLPPATYAGIVTVSGENNISATFNVSFKVNPVKYAVTINGGITDKETAAVGETVTILATQIPEGKEFDKWVADSDDVVFYNASAEETNFTMPAEDVEITATFKDIKYTVTFNANGHGTAPAAQTVTYGSKATQPAAPSATGWTFGGWYTDAACTKAYDFGTTVTANVTLYAKWTQVKYTVTFNANGHGTAPAAQSVAYGSKATQTAAPSATGWTFGGWYTDAACTKAYDFGTTVTANVTLYAKWTVVPTPSPSPSPSPTPVPSANLLGSGMAHVQDFGDTPVSVDPATGILTIGTTGMGKRLEEITINFTNTTPYVGTLQYRVHVQNIGWMDWVNAGQPAGTEGKSLRIEAIELRLTGELAQYYSVEYCVHIEDYGDMQGWVKDGALAGTTGESKRIEEIKIRIVPKGTGDSMTVNYRVHVQDYGWEKSYSTNGQMSGTSGESKRLEGIEIFLSGTQYGGGIKFKTHVQDYGWQDWSYDGEMSGTQGESKRLEGICIELYGEIAEYYDIYYRVHAQDIGWMGWAKNGECAGTAGRSARLEGIQIVLVPKGQPAPGATYQGITAVTTAAFVEGF